MTHDLIALTTSYLSLFHLQKVPDMRNTEATLYLLHENAFILLVRSQQDNFDISSILLTATFYSFACKVNTENIGPSNDRPVFSIFFN